MKLFNIGKRLEKMAPLKIHSERCVHQFSSLATCQRCVDICPRDALLFHQGEWHITNCSNCGMCVLVCPMQCFALDEETLTQAATTHDHLVITCHKEPLADEQMVRVDCLQQLTSELLLRLLNLSDTVTLFVAKETCQGCSNRWMPEGQKIMAAQFGLPMTGLSIVQDKTLRPRHPQRPAAPPETDRRAFFQSFLAGAKHSTKESIVEQIDDLSRLLDEPTDQLTSKPLLVPKRTYLLPLYKKHESQIIPQHQIPYYKLLVKKCHFCEACSKLCPTDALRMITDVNGGKELHYLPALCTQCELCRDVCVHHALQWGDRLSISAFSPAQWQTLCKSEERLCPSCEQPYWLYPPQDEDTCCHFCQQTDACKEKVADHTL